VTHVIVGHRTFTPASYCKTTLWPRPAHVMWTKRTTIPQIFFQKVPKIVIASRLAFAAYYCRSSAEHLIALIVTARKREGETEERGPERDLRSCQLAKEVG
jgi:hypothetical protein